jgi:3'-phosphoadenosine 5'-phosphosulfate sulfotransferase (PAPS reductase)/FAD synthetase
MREILGKSEWFIDGSDAYFTRLRFKSPAQEARLIKIAQQGTKTYPPSRVLKLAVKTHGEGVALLWSGGRCSTALLHMALKIDPEIKVVFVNTGVEYPETVEYVKKLGKEWDINLTILRAERTFWDLIKMYGLPNSRKPSGWRRRGEPHTPPCCYWLKKRPVEYFAKENNIEALITGIRAGESTVRAIVFRQKRSQFYFVKSEKIWKYHPIAFWTTKQVGDYIAKNNIPLNPLYSKLDRVGCWPCTAFTRWKDEMPPDAYQTLKKFFGASPCGEGKPMNHITFENESIGRYVSKLLSSSGIEVEVHDRGKVVCVPLSASSLLKKIEEVLSWIPSS